MLDAVDLCCVYALAALAVGVVLRTLAPTRERG